MQKYKIVIDQMSAEAPSSVCVICTASRSTPVTAVVKARTGVNTANSQAVIERFFLLKPFVMITLKVMNFFIATYLSQAITVK